MVFYQILSLKSKLLFSHLESCMQENLIVKGGRERILVNFYDKFLHSIL